MSKIGIITHYYDSNNYGGMLQAYALVKCLENLGYNVEQICYSTINPITKRKLSVKECIKSLSVRLIGNGLNIRKKAFKNFEEKIAHSDRVYTASTIYHANDDYEIFITGSDQVWSFRWFVSSYFLDFVLSNKTKIAYAASMGASSLTPEDSSKLKEYIIDYSAISLREKDSADFVQTLTNLNVQNTVDPTLLLDNDEWTRISEKKIVGEKYIFCYFLGRDKNIRKLAKQFAKTKKIKLVTLPNLQHHLEVNDLFFGNLKLYDVDPGDFISLIRNAEYILTDSFHATVFSGIFEKRYVVFGRAGGMKMNNRVKNLLELLDNSERFIENPDSTSLQDVCKVADADLHNNYIKLEEMRNISIAFLKDSVRGKI